MTNLGDALQGAFAADASRTTRLDASRAIGAIGRRRAVRAAGMGTAAAVGIGAAGTIWLVAPGGRGFAPAAPSTECTDAELYLPANPEALGDTDFRYRAYIDLRPDSPTHGVVVVREDGTRVRVEPGADGSYPYLGSPTVYTDMPQEFAEQPWVMDNFAWGGGGGHWDGISPVTQDYEWTVDVPANAPAGIDTEQLSSSLRVGMGLGGSGYDSSFVPDGAVVDFIATTTAGETEVSPVAYGGPSEGSQDAASLALRVSNLPGGGSYAITATRHAVDPALTACAPVTGSVSVSATPTGTPAPAPTGVIPGSSPAPGVSQGGAPTILAGPESEVFACGAPLDPQLEGTLGLDVTWQTGAATHELVPGSASTNLSYGAGGVRAIGIPPSGPTAGDPVTAPGWTHAQGGWTSVETFATVAFVRDGVIVGVVPFDVGVEGGVPGDKMLIWGGESDGPQSVAIAVPNVDARMRPCNGEDLSTYMGGARVLLLGSGGIGGPHEFAWTAIEKP